MCSIRPILINYIKKYISENNFKNYNKNPIALEILVKADAIIEAIEDTKCQATYNVKKFNECYDNENGNMYVCPLENTGIKAMQNNNTQDNLIAICGKNDTKIEANCFEC